MQILKLAAGLKITKLVIEDDAKEVILALHGHSQAQDWAGMHQIPEGRRLIQKCPIWKIFHTPHFCHITVHDVTK